MCPGLGVSVLIDGRETSAPNVAPMELIVRTAHGTADVSVDLLDTAVPLRDVIAAVTG